MINPVSEDDAFLDRWTLRKKAAIAICMTGIGSSQVGNCVCARDGREPRDDVPRCRQCLVAAIAAMQVIQ